MAKTIKCDQCGAADLIKNDEYSYTCRYCHSTIIIDKPQFDLGKLSKAFNAGKFSHSQQTTTPSGEIIRTTKNIGCIVLLSIGFVIGGVGFAVMRLVNSSQTTTETKDGWQLSYTPMVFYANGSKGASIWQFTEENYDWKKNRTTLTIFNPTTKKEYYKEIVIPEHESNVTNPSLWDIFSGGKIIGDTIFFTPKDGGLIGRNIFTGKIVVSNDYFEKLIGNEVAEARAYSNSSDNYISIKDAEGTEYVYFPGMKKIIKRDEFNNRSKTKFAPKYFYALAGQTDKKYVMRIQQEMAENDFSPYYGSISLKDYKRDKNYYAKYQKILGIDSIPISHGFFNAEFMQWNDTEFVVRYQKNLLESSPIQISKYSFTGQEKWTVFPSKLSVFSKIPKEKTSFEILVMNETIIIFTNSPNKMACSIDLKNGKTLWSYECLK